MNVTLNSVLLPDDLVWRDEFEWAPVEQVVTPTLSGHCSRAKVQELKVLEAQVAQLMTLTLLDGVARAVVWRRPGVVAMPLIEMADPEGGDPYALTLNLTEVTP